MTYLALGTMTWDLTPADVLLRLVSGLFIGFAIGLTGVGGGVLVIPTLTRLFGFPLSLAVPTANSFAVLARAHATYEHLRLDTIRRRTMFWFLVGGVPMDVVVTGILRLNSTREWIPPSTLEHVLRYCVVAAMVAAGVAVIVNFFIERRRTEGDHYKPTKTFEGSRKIKAVLCGMVIGSLIGGTSIGGGVLVIPMLSGLFALSPNNTVGTSVGISIVLALVNTLFYFVGNPDVPYAASLTTAATMFLGAIPGVGFGSRLAVKISPKWLYGTVMALILVAVTAMLFGGMGGAH